MSKQSSSSRKLDTSTVLGLLVAVGGIAGGLLLEGGRISDIRQLTAALIVLGGTIGAVMVTTPMPLFFAAVKKLPTLFWHSSANPNATIQLLLSLAAQARRKGLVSLERDLDGVADPFLRKALTLAVDGADIQDVRKIMELELNLLEMRGEAEAKVYEAAGGYAPTVGIIGAVLGLIQVMKHLEDIERVGRGIAGAFVATVYGVALANLFLLPAANKLKIRLQEQLHTKEIMLEGALSIAEGLNPMLIRSKLEVYVTGKEEKEHAIGSSSAFSSATARSASVR